MKWKWLRIAMLLLLAGLFGTTLLACNGETEEEAEEVLDVDAPEPVEPDSPLVEQEEDTTADEGTDELDAEEAGPLDESEVPEGEAAVVPVPPLVRGTALVDRPVIGADGAEVAAIEDVLLTEDGAIVSVVLDAALLVERDPAGLVALPWGAFSLQESEELGVQLLLLEDEVDVAAAPAVDPTLLLSEAFLVEAPEELTDAGEFLIRLSRVEGITLTNDAAEIGELTEVIVDVSRGTAPYAVVTVDDLADVDIPVPWDHLFLSADGQSFTLSVEAEVLEGAPTIDLEEWSFGPPDLEWVEQVDDYWAEVTVG